MTKTVLRPWSVTSACSRIISAGWGSPIGSRTRTNRPGTMKRLPLASAGLSILARNRSVPVLMSTRLSVKSTTPSCGKSCLVGQADLDGHRLLPLGLDLELALLHQPLDPEHGLLVDVEVDVERIQADDRGQDRVVGLDQVAGVDHAPAEQPGDRGPDFGPVQVELGQVAVGLGDLEVGLGFLVVGLVAVVFFLADRSRSPAGSWRGDIPSRAARRWASILLPRSPRPARARPCTAEGRSRRACRPSSTIVPSLK